MITGLTQDKMLIYMTTGQRATALEFKQGMATSVI